MHVYYSVQIAGVYPTLENACHMQLVQSDWLLRGPLFHLETSVEIIVTMQSHESAAVPLEHRLSTLVIVLCAKTEFRLDQSDCRSPVR